jgi:uncharacterized protein (DUF1697 family)
MLQYVSFLRGVNVGGKVLKMDPVVELYRSLGLADVRSFIQSGNILFNTGKARREGLEVELEGQIRERLAFQVSVIIRSRTQLRAIVEGNPLAARAGLEPKGLYVTLLEKDLSNGRTRELPRDEKSLDEFLPSGAEIYLYCPGGYGRTVYSNAYFEKLLGMRATTRNWNTITRLLDMAEAAAPG